MLITKLTDLAQGPAEASPSSLYDHIPLGGFNDSENPIDLLLSETSKTNGKLQFPTQVVITYATQRSLELAEDDATSADADFPKSESIWQTEGTLTFPRSQYQLLKRTGVIAAGLLQ